jgi:hypothetical protein
MTKVTVTAADDDTVITIEDLLVCAAAATQEQHNSLEHDLMPRAAIGKRSKVEAAGIEPASRGTSVPVSTCVACLFWSLSSDCPVFILPDPNTRGSERTIGQNF